MRSLLGRLHQAGSDRLGPIFADLDELKLLAEAGQVAVLGEGLSRGDVRESDAASPADAADAPAVPAPAGPPSRVSVVVRVPSDYYLRHYEAVRGEQTPTPDDLALFVTRTEESIRSAVGLVVPREDLARLAEQFRRPGATTDR